jgi:diamine N-acetyltransferase
MNTIENMTMYLADFFSEASLSGELINPDPDFFLAMHGDQVIAYLKINTGELQTELKDKIHWRSKGSMY